MYEGSLLTIVFIKKKIAELNQICKITFHIKLFYFYSELFLLYFWVGAVFDLTKSNKDKVVPLGKSKLLQFLLFKQYPFQKLFSYSVRKDNFQSKNTYVMLLQQFSNALSISFFSCYLRN